MAVSGGLRDGLRLLALLAMVTAGAAGPAPAWARDINLGGKVTKDKGDTDQKPALRYIELPRIFYSTQRPDGGWNHVQIDAYLAPKDQGTLMEMDAIRSLIVDKASGEDLPRIGFDNLKRPSYGNDFAKQAIHDAAEHSIGHPWTGDVFIRSMLVY